MMITATSNNRCAPKLKDFGEGVGFATAATYTECWWKQQSGDWKRWRETFARVPQPYWWCDHLHPPKINIFNIIDIPMKGVTKRLSNLDLHRSWQKKQKLYCRQRMISSLCTSAAQVKGHSEIPERSSGRRDPEPAYQTVGDVPMARWIKENSKISLHLEGNQIQTGFRSTIFSRWGKHQSWNRSRQWYSRRENT